MDCLGESNILELPESWYTPEKIMLTGSGTCSRERCMLQSNLNGIVDLKSHLTSDMESQSSEFASSFLTMLPSIYVGMIKYFLYPEMLNLFLDFNFFYRAITVKRLYASWKSLYSLDFETS